MSNEAFNKTLWALQVDAGWLFWIPFVCYGFYGIWYLYSLAAAETKMGRIIRVLLAVAFFSMIFMPAFNGLGPYAFHFLALSACMMITQQYKHCKAMGKITPPQAETVLGRVVERMVDKPTHPYAG